MVSAVLANRVKVASSTTGTGTITLGSAITKYCTFAEAGITNSQVVTYLIEEGNDFEIGRGTYTSSGTTLSRDTVLLSKIGGTAGTSKMNLAGAETISIVAGKEDLDVNDFDEDTSPLGETDFLWAYDVSASLKKKNKATNLKRSGGWQLLTSGSASGASTLDIVLTSYTGYRAIMIALYNIVPATDDVQLLCRFSTNGGSSYDSGASDYDVAGNNINTNGTATQFNSSATSSIPLCNGTAGRKLSSDSGSNAAFSIFLHNRLGSVATSIHGLGYHIDTNQFGEIGYFGGHRQALQDTDAIQFLMASGNLTLDYAIYGMI